MTYLNARRRAEIMTVILLFREIASQCYHGGDPENKPAVAVVIAYYDVALADALAGLDKAEVDKALSRAKRSVTAILAPWVEAQAAVPKVFLMCVLWLQRRIEDGHFVIEDGPFKTGYEMFARMAEASDEDMRNLSAPKLQRSALKGVSKLDAAFQERFG